MKGLLLVLLLLPSAAFAADPVDWRAAKLPDASVSALRGLGYRLETDGKAFGPDGLPLDAAGLAAALERLAASGRRAALERLRLVLASEPADKPLAGEARARAVAAAPADLVAAIGRGDTAGQLKAAVSLDLERLAGLFDGGLGKVAGAVAAPSGAKAPFPYTAADDKKAGDALRSAAASELAKLPRGKLILSRLKGDLPAILIEDSDTPAHYDPRRRALVLDRETAVSALTDGLDGPAAGAARRSLAQPGALAARLADPASAAKVVALNDVLIAHELTHAWQDRRDPLYRRMIEGGLPEALVLEYEEEAFVEKNLYLHEKLKATPGARVEPAEIDDYRAMMDNYKKWQKELFRQYRSSAPASASDLDEIASMQAYRVETARNASAATDAEQRAKAEKLRLLGRGSRDLAAVKDKHAERMAAYQGKELKQAGSELNGLLAKREYELALDAPNEIQKAVHLENAEQYAEQAGDKDLLEKIRSLKGRRR